MWGKNTAYEDQLSCDKKAIPVSFNPSAPRPTELVDVFTVRPPLDARANYFSLIEQLFKFVRETLTEC